MIYLIHFYWGISFFRYKNVYGSKKNPLIFGFSKRNSVDFVYTKNTKVPVLRFSDILPSLFFDRCQKNFLQVFWVNNKRKRLTPIYFCNENSTWELVILILLSLRSKSNKLTFCNYSVDFLRTLINFIRWFKAMIKTFKIALKK